MLIDHRVRRAQAKTLFEVTVPDGTRRFTFTKKQAASALKLGRRSKRILFLKSSSCCQVFRNQLICAHCLCLRSYYDKISIETLYHGAALNWHVKLSWFCQAATRVGEESKSAQAIPSSWPRCQLQSSRPKRTDIWHYLARHGLHRASYL